MPPPCDAHSDALRGFLELYGLWIGDRSRFEILAQHNALNLVYLHVDITGVIEEKYRGPELELLEGIGPVERVDADHLRRPEHGIEKRLAAEHHGTRVKASPLELDAADCVAKPFCDSDLFCVAAEFEGSGNGV